MDAGAIHLGDAPLGNAPFARLARTGAKPEPLDPRVECRNVIEHPAGSGDQADVVLKLEQVAQYFFDTLSPWRFDAAFFLE